MTSATAYAGQLQRVLETSGFSSQRAVDEVPHLRWYGRQSRSGGVGAHVLVEWKPRLGGYSVQFGFSDLLAAPLRASVEGIVRTLNDGMWPPKGLPCWTLFNAGRLLSWPLLVAPNPTDPDEWCSQLTQLQHEVFQRTIEQVDTSEDLVSLLLRTSKPFEWGACNPVARAAEVLASALTACQSDRTTLQQLEALLPHLPRSFSRGSRWKDVLVQIYEAMVDLKVPQK